MKTHISWNMTEYDGIIDWSFLRTTNFLGCFYFVSQETLLQEIKLDLSCSLIFIIFRPNARVVRQNINWPE